MTAATLSACWPDGTRDRFDRHWEKGFALPDTNFPRLISKSIKNIPVLLRGRFVQPWKIKTVNGQTAKALLRHHQRGPTNIRKARNQRRHTDAQILSLLFARVNIQPYHSEFTWLEIRRTSIEDMIKETGFSKTCVTDSLARLKKAGLLRTRRNKNQARDREWVATRWLTAAAFDMLGLGSWLAKAKEGQYTKRKQRDADIAALEDVDIANLPRDMREKLERAQNNARNRPPDKPHTEGEKIT